MLKKIVDGKEVVMPDDEEASLKEEWSNNSAKPPIDMADIDNQDKRVRVMCAVIAQLTAKPLSQVAAAFRAEWNKP